MKAPRILPALALIALAASAAQAASVAISIGIRETGNVQPKFANGGSTGGIEWVNRDGQNLNLDGTWQLFTFTPNADALLAFAGASANSVLDTDWGVLEHIRILNNQGVTQPIRLWIDNVTNTDVAGSAIEGFENFAIGDEVMFQEPSFSGSTSANLVVGSTSDVTDSMAFAGSQSYQVDAQFVDGTPTRWIRLTTFGTPNVPNPAVHLREPGGPNPTISFYMKGVAIPEPATLALAGLALVGMVAARRRGA
jgi:hypothetical protein